MTLLDPPVLGSEQFSLQQSRAIETSGALPVDFAFLQQAGIFPSAQDPSAALAPTVPPARMITIKRHMTRFRIARKLYLARRISVKAIAVLSSSILFCSRLQHLSNFCGYVSWCERFLQEVNSRIQNTVIDDRVVCIA